MTADRGRHLAEPVRPLPFDHWIDIALALGLLAEFLATIIVLARRMPVYSNWEMSRES